MQLVGESKTVKAVDTIRLSEVEGGKTKVSYHVDLTLKSWRRPFIVFVSSALDALGKAAMDGMRKTITNERLAQLAAVGDNA